MKSLEVAGLVVAVFGILEAIQVINLFPPIPSFDPDQLIGAMLALFGAFLFLHTRGR